MWQGGGWPRGQTFAARWADTIIPDGGGSVESMKAYREDVRRRAAEIGRDPDSIKVLFLAYPIMDTTMEAARERRRLEREAAEKNVAMQLSAMSRTTAIAFSTSYPTRPLPAPQT